MPEQTERLRLSFFSYEAEEKEDAPEQPERRRVPSALVDEGEKGEGGCSGAPTLAEEEAECPDSPEEEEEAGASNSEG